MRKAALYLGIPSEDRGPSGLGDLRRLAGRRRWVVVGEYVESDPDLEKGKRPALAELLDDAEAGRFEVVAVESLDGVARSGRRLLDLLRLLRGLGVDLTSRLESVDTAGPGGWSVVDVVASVVRLQDRLEAERIREGMRRAREFGKRPGRPPVESDPRRVFELRSRGLSLRAIGRIVGVSHTTVAKMLRSRG